MYKIIGGDQKEYGPVSPEQLASWVRDNRANGQTLVQREGGPWVPLGSLPEFTVILSEQGGGGAGAIPASVPSEPGSVPSSSPAPTGGFGSGGSGGLGGGPGPAWGGGGANEEHARERALQMVSGPATGLLVTGILCAVLSLVGLVGSLMGAQFQPPPGEVPPELQQFFDMMQNFQGPMAIVGSLFNFAISGLAIMAARKLRTLESFAFVVTATILTMVPCLSPCCCLGLPVGIWILVVVFKPEVKSVFR